MAILSNHHRELDASWVGRCSVPMWAGGCPAGFCDEPACGTRPESKMWRRHDGSLVRDDGKYDGYVPALACPAHGGPTQAEAASVAATAAASEGGGR